MEFYVHRSDLLKELEFAEGSVGKKTTVPILSHVLLEPAESNVRLSATDLELGTRSTCPARVKAAGVATVPARRLIEILRALPDAEVRFRLLENCGIHVTCERSSFRLVGLAKDNFPALPVLPQSQAELTAGLLKQLLERRRFAVSEEENRFTLNGALLLLNPGTVNMVATDGHRLALVEKEQSFARLTTEVRLLIPKRTLDALYRVVAEAAAEASISITSDQRHMFFSVGDRLLISRLLTGTFPNYDSVLPRENNKILELDRDQVRAALRRVSLLASEQSNAVRLLLEKDRLEIISSGGEYGEATEILDARNDHDPVKIGFNYRYLLDFFDVVGSNRRIRMTLKDEQSSVEFQPEEQDGVRYRYVVMPLRL